MTSGWNILVTGGAGFLGSHLCARLIGSGARVVCVDNFYTGTRENIAHLLGNPAFTLIEADVADPPAAELPNAPGGFDRIYNLACPASPPHYQRDPIFTMKTSVIGALRMLELAERTGARFLQASTSEVYGDPKVHPQPESYTGSVNPIGHRACYDEGKRAAEALCFDFRRTRGVDIRVARIFNTYGPRMHPFDGRVVSNFIRQALAGEDITLHGDGSQTRSFCYVDDLVKGLVLLMEDEGGDGGVARSTGDIGHDGRDARPTGDGRSGGFDRAGPVNLGNPDEFTVRELAELVITLTGSGSGLERVARPEDDPARRRPDISLARERLGWLPVVPLRPGLEKTIAWFRSIDVSRYSSQAAPAV